MAAADFAMGAAPQAGADDAAGDADAGYDYDYEYAYEGGGDGSAGTQVYLADQGYSLSPSRAATALPGRAPSLSVTRSGTAPQLFGGGGGGGAAGAARGGRLERQRHRLECDDAHRAAPGGALLEWEQPV